MISSQRGRINSLVIPDVFNKSSSSLKMGLSCSERAGLSAMYRCFSTSSISSTDFKLGLCASRNEDA